MIPGTILLRLRNELSANQTVWPVADMSWGFHELRRGAASRSVMAAATAIRSAPSSHHSQAGDSVVVDVGCADGIDVIAEAGVWVTVTVSTGVEQVWATPLSSP